MEDLLPLLPTCHLSGEAEPMECLNINDGNGQAYGFTLYRKNVARVGQVKVEGAVRDRTQVYYWQSDLSCFVFDYDLHPSDPQVLLNAELLTTFDCNALDVAFSLVCGPN